jgi:hypothetical protein
MVRRTSTKGFSLTSRTVLGCYGVKKADILTELGKTYAGLIDVKFSVVDISGSETFAAIQWTGAATYDGSQPNPLFDCPAGTSVKMQGVALQNYNAEGKISHEVRFLTSSLQSRLTTIAGRLWPCLEAWRGIPLKLLQLHLYHMTSPNQDLPSPSSASF